MKFRLVCCAEEPVGRAEAELQAGLTTIHEARPMANLLNLLVVLPPPQSQNATFSQP